MDATAIMFEDWEHALTAGHPAERYHAYREAIVKFRCWLRKTDNVSYIDAFKRHLAWKQSYLVPDRFAVRREALRHAFAAHLLTGGTGIEIKRPSELLAGL